MYRILNALSAAAVMLAAQPALAQIASLNWRTIDGGGGTSTAQAYSLSGTIGQPDAGVLSGGGMTIVGGFWGVSPASPCYANCDSSTTPPILNVADFICFQNRFNSADPRANCDNSTTAPILNVQDFICFANKFASGCP